MVSYVEILAKTNSSISRGGSHPDHLKRLEAQVLKGPICPKWTTDPTHTLRLMLTTRIYSKNNTLTTPIHFGHINRLYPRYNRSTLSRLQFILPLSC